MLLANPFNFIAPISQKFAQNPDIYKRFKMDGHNGLDFAIPVGTELFAMCSAKVTKVSYEPQGYGNCIRLMNDAGQEIVCGHLSEVFVKEGDLVAQGQKIGLTGNTGFSTGPHLHFGLRQWENGMVKDYKNGFFGYIDPLPVLVDYGKDIQLAEPEKDITVIEIPVEKFEQNLEQVQKVVLPASEQPSAWAKEGYDFVIEEGISNGERPREEITREEFWLTLYRFTELFDDEDDDIENLKDIHFQKLSLQNRPSEWAEAAYIWAVSYQISNGERPKEFISREEMWLMLDRFFQDFPEFRKGTRELKEPGSEWAQEAQQWIVVNGISNGERPRSFVSREEVWVMFLRIAEILE